MTAKPVTRVPDVVLTTPAKTIVHFDKKLRSLVREMEKTLHATTKPKGVGLAAPQISEPYRVFITKPTPKAKIRLFINPEILSVNNQVQDTERDKKLEGCLSIPDIWGNVTRPQEVTLRYQDIDGNIHEEVITGFLATIVQHETDHTNGILFTQRVAEQNGKFYKSAIDENGKDVLDEITLG